MSQTPARSTLEALETRAINMAAMHKAALPKTRRRAEDRPRLIKRLKTQRILLHDAYLLFVRISEQDELHSYAAEWMLDNYYIIQAAMRQVVQDLPEKYYRQLPRLEATRMAGLPRVYAIARELVYSQDARLDLDQVEIFVNAYQNVTPLTMGELWAVPIMLRFNLIEALTQAATRALDIDTLDEGSMLDEIATEASPDIVIANAITSLRAIAAYAWPAFFERSSLVERILRGDPSRVYSRMDFTSRNNYRGVIERYALETEFSQAEIARQAVALARYSYSQNPRDQKRGHVGYYLVAHGRRTLEKAINYQPVGIRRLRRWMLDHPSRAYLGTVGLLTLLVIALLLLFTAPGALNAWQILLALALALVPTMALAVNLVNWAVMQVLPPRRLPRLNYSRLVDTDEPTSSSSLDSVEGIPSSARTVVVIPALLSSLAEIDSLLSQLEQHYLRNDDPNLAFGLLTDFTDASQEVMPGDEVLVERVLNGLRALQQRYPNRPNFFLLHRARRWNAREQVWMGWERKRGKLEEFNRLLSGAQDTSFTVQAGNLGDFLHAPGGVRYVITLDSDTVLPAGSAAALVGVMAHPLNSAHFSSRTGRVTSGYTVLQPRTEIRPESAGQTHFTRIFAGDTGLDLYSLAVSDVYQDLFGEGIYVGKGIYDVQAFMRSTHNQIPENAILSHDLLEGLLGRSGLVSDIVLYEGYPPTYPAYLRRLERWIRGDWQLLPWLLGLSPDTARPEQAQERHSLRLIDRWMITDNLRRSLFPILLLLLLVAGWLVFPGSPLAWTLFAVFTTLGPLFTSLAGQQLRPRETTQVETIRPKGGFTRAERNQITRWLLSWIFLPHEALMSLRAILLTIGRVLFTQRGLLEWTTAASVEREYDQASGTRTSTWREMSASLVLSLILLGLVAWLKPSVVPLALIFTLGWLSAPWVSTLLNRPITEVVQPLSTEETNRLRRLARRTWYFFERFVGPGDHWLPPDHFQETPKGQVAHRTSTTNIGLGLVATLAAYDLGYSSMSESLMRIHNMINTMDELEMVRGHFLNWYDTRTLQPLPPRYISTVDNGNLAGCMLALRQGVWELKWQPLVRWERWQGLSDTLAILRESLQVHTQPGSALFTHEQEHPNQELDAMLAAIQKEIQSVQGQPAEWSGLLDRLLNNHWPAIQGCLLDQIEAQAAQISPGQLQSLRIWAERVHYQLGSMRREEQDFTPWVKAFANPPDLIQQIEPRSALDRAWVSVTTLLAPNTCLDCLARDEADIRRNIDRLRDLLLEDHFPSRPVQEALDWCDNLITGFEHAIASARQQVAEIDRLAAWLDRCLAGMNFGFLYNAQRNIFYIGYNVDAERMDSNYYDLLASESRIASLIAIARGDVPRRHWLHLSRPIIVNGNDLLLLSWSGTMFEYLMPPLLLREAPDTLLNQSARAAVRAQIDYGARHKVPWGISESGYYYFDANQNYQYRAFGVPGLGIKRGLSDDLVISPYASLLALRYAPHSVLENLKHLDRLAMLRDFGYYEAIDFTHSRLPLGQEHARVASFMAHHQGMILLSLANHLQNDRFVERLHANPVIKSVELLLHEQVPQEAVTEQLSEEDEMPRPVLGEPALAVSPWTAPDENSFPRVHYLSNGNYSLLITNHGSGYSAWQGPSDNAPRALTRWRSDSTLDDWGSLIYLRDADSDGLWTVGSQLLPIPGGTNVIFSPHQAEFHNTLDGLNLHLQVTVHPDEDLEIRLLNLTNSGDTPRRLSLTSYGEVVLTSLEADRRHPAFQKIIIESDFDPRANALIFNRRPRAVSDPPVFLMHSLVVEPGLPGQMSYESERGSFIGRGHTPRNPVALRADAAGLPANTGALLDPIFALQHEITIPPHSHARVAFLTAAGQSRVELTNLAQQFSDWNQIDRAFDKAHHTAELEIRRLLVTNQGSNFTQDLEHYQGLLSTLIYPQPGLRAASELLAASTLGQPSLWALGISGDYPILLLTVGAREELTILREILPAHAFWRNRGLRIDLVILTDNPSGYGQEVHDRVLQTILRTGHGDWVKRRGGIYLVQRDSLDEPALALLYTAARAILTSVAGPLSTQLRAMENMPLPLPAFVPVGPPPPDNLETLPLPRPEDLRFDNGWGGFNADGSQYQVYITPGSLPPAPWINVIANPQAGFWVSEAGGGYSWAANSGENRLTPWSNDPVSDRPGEALYLRDEETAAIWSPTPLPAGEDLPFLVRHSPGLTVFEHHSHGLRQELSLFMHRELPVKIIHLRLENLWQRPRRITATYYAEWVLGVNRDDSQLYIVPEYDHTHQALLARNPYNVEFEQRMAFLATGLEVHGLTTNRTEFLGLSGDYRRPSALQRVGLSGQVQSGVDPCAALQVHIDLAPGETCELFFLLGQGEDRAEALACIEQLDSLERVQAARADVLLFWQDQFDALQVETPDPAMDILLNRWLIYQDLSCRIWGRSALYQSSGAYGFRDQLQDVLALLPTAPDLSREHIVRAAQYQFSEGDVLHWWHPPSGRGVRTRHSDDLLWLPYVTAEYCAAIGDETILDESVPFLLAEPLREDEDDRYGHFPSTPEGYSLYEHCLRAIQHASTSGPHGLPLFGTGDWNDGMNRVGAGGVGESVWLGWFLIEVLQRFIPICRGRGDEDQANEYEQQIADLRQALHAHAWDGQWFLRGFYDSGEPLGSASSEECQIDSLAQSWAVLSGAGNQSSNHLPAGSSNHGNQQASPQAAPEGSTADQENQHERIQLAMQSVLDRLVQPEGSLLRLFIPPFDQTELDPGYIKAYPPGIRENGGQYTHAAIWTVWAFTHLGQGSTAARLFELLNPINHASTPESAALYRVEPYVIAADVYSEPPHVGRGGWTWYTGSGGWMYRLGVEAILGLHRRGSQLLIDPCIPSSWPAFSLRWRLGSTRYNITVQNPQSVEFGVVRMELDGRELPELAAPLVDDGQEHQLIVILGPDGSRPSLNNQGRTRPAPAGQRAKSRD